MWQEITLAKGFELKFIPNQSEIFRIILKFVSKQNSFIPNQSEEIFQSVAH